MSQALDDLDPTFRPLAVELLARCVEHNIPVKICCTRRSDADQAVAVATGHSWVPRSKHQDGLAIDICPWEVWNLHAENKLEWDANDPVWQLLGKIGASIGFVGKAWGGNWQQKDLGHFEMPA